jgi:predicted nucleic acid-binding protein
VNYWDTSALVKLYVAETDSDDYLNLAAQAPTIPAVSDLVRVELLAALHRKELKGELPAGHASLLHAQFVTEVEGGAMQILPVGPGSFREAERVLRTAYASQPPTPIRTLDALHVAMAVAENADALVSADTRQRNVAALAGMTLLP